MAGIIAVYSLVIAVLLASDIGPPPETSYSPFKYVGEQETAAELVSEGANTSIVASCIWQQAYLWV